MPGGGSRRGSHRGRGAAENAHIRDYYNKKVGAKYGKRPSGSFYGGGHGAGREDFALQLIAAAQSLIGLIGRSLGRAHRHIVVDTAQVCRYLELGTSKMKKHPFMSKAFKSATPEALEVLKQSIMQGIDDACRK